jgi:SAM-dependent methyltransferase
MDDAAAPRLAAAIQALVRAHGAPPPRGLPWLGLEHPSGTGIHLLEALADRGIFRKYELVLDLGAGLGASSRWLAGRLACEAVGTTGSVAEAAAGRELTRRAQLGAQVRLVPAAPEALPFRAGRFTHVWILETLARVADADATLAEAFRVVRRGGSIAVQDLTPARHPAVELPGWRFTAADARAAVNRGADARAAALRRAGFVERAVRDRSAEAGERSPRVAAARARLLALLDADPLTAPLAAERRALAAALARGALGVVQLLARRP